FEELRSAGFFDIQGRRNAQRVLEEIQENSGVIEARVTLSPGQIVQNEEAVKANHHVLQSAMTVDIDAMEDSDVFRYIYLIEEYFPGHITVEKINMKRERDLSADILKSIASKKEPKMVG